MDPFVSGLRKAQGSWEDNLFFPQLKCGLVTVPKAANTSLKYFLIGRLADHEQLIIKDEIKKLGDPQSIHGVLRRSKFACKKHRLYHADVSKIISSVRAPINRIVSFYKDKVLGNGWNRQKKEQVRKLYGFSSATSFPDFVDIICAVPDSEAEIHFRSQSDIIGQKLILDSRMVFVRSEMLYLDLGKVFGSSISDGLEAKNKSDRIFGGVKIDAQIVKKLRRRYSADYDLVDRIYFDSG